MANTFVCIMMHHHKYLRWKGMHWFWINSGHRQTNVQIIFLSITSRVILGKQPKLSETQFDFLVNIRLL